MLSFLARTFLLLAAAFGLGAIGGRATRRRGPAKAGESSLAKARPAKAIGGMPADDAAPDALLAGAIAGETGSEVGGSNMLAESTGSAPPAVGDGPDAADAATGDATWAQAADAEPPVEPASDGADAPSAAAPDIAEAPLAAFASYGGSGVSAGFERVGDAGAPRSTEPDDGKPLRTRSRWSEPSPATTAPAGDDAPSTEAATPGNLAPDEPASDPLSAPDIHDRIPPGKARDGVPEDALAAKHRSDSFDSDFRTVDYAQLGEEPAPRPASGVGAMDDGWTVPEDGGLAGQPVFEESPAAFRSGGGSAPLRGAPEGEEDAGDASVTGAETPAPEAADAAALDPGDDVPPATETIALPPHPESPAIASPAGNRLEAARGGVPDDLTRISGIGPSIERLLFENGIFHFDQIATWTDDDAHWADALSGFRGRVAREKWIEQARVFAEAKG